MGTHLEWTTLSAPGVGAASDSFFSVFSILYILRTIVDTQALSVWILREIVFSCSGVGGKRNFRALPHI